jgi:hypothetical protein
MIPVAVASLAAIAIQPLVLGIWLGVPMYLSGESVPAREVIGMAGLVTMVAAGFVLVIGIPSFLILRHLNRATAISLGTMGFLVAALPFAALGWPGNSFPGSSSGGGWHGSHVEFVVNGMVTGYGWLNYAEGTLIYGTHGLIGALAFLFVWRRLVARTIGSSDRVVASSVSQGGDG